MMAVINEILVDSMRSTKLKLNCKSKAREIQHNSYINTTQALHAVEFFKVQLKQVSYQGLRSASEYITE